MEDEEDLDPQNEAFEEFNRINETVSQTEDCPEIGREEIVSVKPEADSLEELIPVEKQPVKNFKTRTKLTREEYLKKQRDLYHQRRADLTEEQKQIERMIRNQYLAKKLLDETTEERQERLRKRRMRNHRTGKANAYNRYYYRLKKDQMTEERRQKIRDYHIKRRERLKQQNPNYNSELMEKRNEYYQKYWANISDEKRKERLQRRREKYINMTKDEREQKKAYERERSAKIKKGEWMERRNRIFAKRKAEYADIINKKSIITHFKYKNEPYKIRNVNNLHIINRKEPILKLERITNYHPYDVQSNQNITNKTKDPHNITAYTDFEDNYHTNVEIPMSEITYETSSHPISDKFENINTNKRNEIDNIKLVNTDTPDIVITIDSQMDKLGQKSKIIIKHRRLKNNPRKLNKNIPILTENIIICKPVNEHTYAVAYPNKRITNNPRRKIKHKSIKSKHKGINNIKCIQNYKIDEQQIRRFAEPVKQKWECKSNEYTFGKVQSFVNHQKYLKEKPHTNKKRIPNINDNIELIYEYKSKNKLLLGNNNQYTKIPVNLNYFISGVPNPLLDIIKSIALGKSIHNAISELTTDMLRKTLNFLGCNYSEDILSLQEYNVNMVKFEIDVNCLIKTMVNWSESRNMKKININVLEETYNDIFSYLNNFEKLTKPKHKFMQEKFSVVKKVSKQDFVMIVCCSLKQLQRIFNPQYVTNAVHDSVNKYLKRASLSRNSYPAKIVYWPYISTKLYLPKLFSMILQNTQYSEFHLVNKKKHYNIPPYESKSTQLHFKPSSIYGEFYSEFIMAFLNQFKYAVNNLNNSNILDERKMELSTAIAEFENVIKLCTGKIQTNTLYQMNLTSYPYIRYLGDNKFEEDVNTAKMEKSSIENVRLQQIHHPQISFAIEHFNVLYEVVDGNIHFVFDDDFLEIINTCISYKCILCDEDLGSYFPSKKITDHLTDFHGNEPDWKCVICSKSYSTRQLSINRWQHNCYKIN